MDGEYDKNNAILPGTGAAMNLHEISVQHALPYDVPLACNLNGGQVILEILILADYFLMVVVDGAGIVSNQYQTSGERGRTSRLSCVSSRIHYNRLVRICIRPSTRRAVDHK